jgi:predicted DNA-binding transcriptional regulator YafY
MSESPQLVRQWKLQQMLESSRSGCTVQELMSEAEVSDKTIRRDLKVLQNVFDIKERTGDSGVKRWRMKPLADQVGFNYTELLAIHMSQQFMEPLAGTPFWEGNRIVLRKVKGAIGDNAVRYIEKLSAGLHATTVGASDYTQRGEMIDQLMVAIEDRKVTLIVYQSMQATEAVEQEVYPLGMVHHRGSLYLIAWSSRREEVRYFKLDRVESVDIQNLQYQVPPNFDLQEWLSKSFGVWRSGSEDLQTIRIHFARPAARYVQESTWHESQQLFPQEDGTVIAEFELPDTQEIKRWIMSFGPNAGTERAGRRDSRRPCGHGGSVRRKDNTVTEFQRNTTEQHRGELMNSVKQNF